MGRSRAVSHAADEDPSQSRSKRKRPASNTENLENASTGLGMSDGKGALYHCNYCNKDISGKIRIKCAVCSDFDLCIECFSVGAEVTPHKSGHPYRVMDNLAFPLICPDWNADEEILLLEGTEMYGLGNWTEVAEHVGTKKKSECIDHYNSVYMNSPCFPLPDLSHVMGKSREELLAMGKEHNDSKKGTHGEIKKEESPFATGIKIEDSRKEVLAVHSSLSLIGGVGYVGGKTSMVAAKRASNMNQNKDSWDKPKVEGLGMSDGKGALYHCNYCNKDISGKIRIKCAVCSDFDLCIECFSVGAEVTPHKSGHPYRVMDNLAFPLICPDWNADEEILLLEGTEMYGLGNWTEVAEHVGTKKKSECIDHYNSVYMNSPCFPLPDLSHVMGKSREELLAMGKEHNDSKKGTHGEIKKEESPFATGIKIEDSRKEVLAVHSSLSLIGGVGYVGGKTSMVAAKRASNMNQNKDSWDKPKVEERTTGEKKLKLSHDEAPTMTEVNGYNLKRQEFEVEYDNDAEQLLADMEFKDSDTAAERELKSRVLRIYSKRLDERKRRKDFVLERGLLYADPYEKTLSPEEKDIYNKYKVFMRFMPKQEYEDMVKTAIEEHRILKRIQEFQEARAAGCRTSSEAKRYMEKKIKEAEENARKIKESIPPGPGGKALMRANHIKGEFDGSPRNGPRGSSMVLESGSKDLFSPNVGHNSTLSSSLDVWDVSGFPGADLLSDAEKQLCSEIQILPAHYLSMMQTISMGMLKGSITQKQDAYPLFKVDSIKVDRVYDELLKKGFSPQ